MGIQDRDWYREDYKKREAKYGDDLRSASSYHGFHDLKKEETNSSYKTAANGRSTDPDYVIAPGSCSNCGKIFRVRVRRSEIEKYSYTCPNCGQVIIVTSKTAETVSNINGYLIDADLVSTSEMFF